jgi:hypothetical protein
MAHVPPIYDPKRSNAHPAFGLYFRRYAPFATFGFGFEGDNRGPSTATTVTSRTYGCVMFNKEGVFYWFSGSSGTQYRSFVWGLISAHAKVSMDVEVEASTRSNQVSFSASTAGSMPLLPKSPDIDSRVTALAEFSPQNLHIEGSVFGDSFPNAEVFVLCYRSKHTALLFDGRTTGGRNTGPIARLAGRGAAIWLGQFDRNFKLDDKGELARDDTTFATTLPSP